MRPKAIVLFERLLLAALAIDLVNNLASWSTMTTAMVAKGITPNPALVLFMCLASPLLGLAFLYLIARRRSGVAKWIMAILVALATVTFINTMVTQSQVLTMPIFIVGVLSELLKLAAVAMLFTKDAARWFAS